jgi:mRNA-degrading endonuclease RelE of RelBE toxin-antitoxin system
MPYELYIERHAEKDLNKLPPHLFSQIAAKIKRLPSDPHPQESKKIKGSLKDWRLRIAWFRKSKDYGEKHIFLLLPERFFFHLGSSNCVVS